VYAIVDIAGKQFRISEKDVLSVPRLAGSEGEKIVLDKILLLSSDKGVKVGKPLVAGAKIHASILAHDRDKKILVFKRKRRKGYRVKKGHRQDITKIEIEKISAKA
jgi:large subunit ribosomal protein L21